MGRRREAREDNQGLPQDERCLSPFKLVRNVAARTNYGAVNAPGIFPANPSMSHVDSLVEQQWDKRLIREGKSPSQFVRIGLKKVRRA